MAAPSGVVTFLFTDVEGSTRRWEADADGMRVALAALDHVTLAIRNYHDAGNTTGARSALAILAALFGRLGRHEAAAIIAGFALSPFTSMLLPEFNNAIAHLRAVLGDQTYDSLAREGKTMTTAEMAAYAYDQIDQARTELTDPPEFP